MKTHIVTLSEEPHVQIEVEPVLSLVVQFADLPSLQELQHYAHAHGIIWMVGNQGLHCLFLPRGTLLQRIEECCTDHEEVYLVHLPGGGVLEHRRVLSESADLRAGAPGISTLSLLRPVC